MVSSISKQIHSVETQSFPLFLVTKKLVICTRIVLNSVFMYVCERDTVKLPQL